jgi:hypothetical protein
MILDLDTNEIFNTVPKKTAKTIFIKPQVTAPVFSAPNKEVFSPEEQKLRLLRKLEEEDSYIRHQRALTHQKYFTLMKPDLTPLSSKVDFSSIYEEMELHQANLQSIWIKKQQLEKTGTIHQPKFLTQKDMMEIGSLKHERSNHYKNISKWKKKLEASKAEGNQLKANNAESKIQEFELRILDLSHRIKILENDAKLD